MDLKWANGKEQDGNFGPVGRLVVCQWTNAPLCGCYIDDSSSWLIWNHQPAHKRFTEWSVNSLPSISNIQLPRPYLSSRSRFYWHPFSVSCTALRISFFNNGEIKRVIYYFFFFAFLQVCGQDMFLRTGLENGDLHWQTGWIALRLFLRPPSRVFLRFSSNVTYSVSWSSYFNLKSSTNNSWCSWQPGRPERRVHEQIPQSIKEWLWILLAKCMIFPKLLSALPYGR